MRPVPTVAVPPVKPLLLFDGDCAFCARWIHRWQRSTGGRVDFLPFQDPQLQTQFPELDLTRSPESIILLETSGSVFRGAEAVFRALTHSPRDRWLLEWYQDSPAFACASEWAYRQVATHRGFFSRLTRLAWGTDSASGNNQLSRWLFLRSLGLVYLVAFVSLWLQLPGLFGVRGISPVGEMMDLLHQQAEAAHVGWERYHLVPTFCWVNAGNVSLNVQCAAGALCAGCLILNLAPAACLFLLWLLYLSLVTVGGEFLSFQWDSLLLEIGFLAIFFAPLQLRPGLARAPPPSRLVLGLLRWLLFRLMFASGCVKLGSGDPTWHNLTALNFHYETQPLPTWLGWYVFQFPVAFHRASTAIMFAIELVLPFFIFAPRRLRFIACAGFIALQVLIFLTGNYCFFNLLTIALSLLLLDDQALRRLMPSRWLSMSALAGSSEPGVPSPPLSRRTALKWPLVILVPLAGVTLLLTLVQFSGLFRARVPWPRPIQAVYSWLAPLRSCNSYGLFAVMTTNRLEIIVEGSNDGVSWLPYEFEYKPGDLRRRPRFVEPHQPRLDWQMWFAALGDYRQNPWFVNFCLRLLQGSPEVLALLEHNPFPKKPPRYLRANAYEYHFTDLATHRRTGAWWQRELKGPYLPVISLQTAARSG